MIFNLHRLKQNNSFVKKMLEKITGDRPERFEDKSRIILQSSDRKVEIKEVYYLGCLGQKKGLMSIKINYGFWKMDDNAWIVF